MSAREQIEALGWACEVQDKGQQQVGPLVMHEKLFVARKGRRFVEGLSSVDSQLVELGLLETEEERIWQAMLAEIERKRPDLDSTPLRRGVPKTACAASPKWSARSPTSSAAKALRRPQAAVLLD
jgi:hypothetical protein